MLDSELKKLAQERRDKDYAHSSVSRAIKKGLLNREPCFCGETKVEGHHKDYSKVLEVIWLCKKHHVQADKKYREHKLLVEYGIRL